MKVLFIGDIHIKHSNITDIDILINTFSSYKDKADIVVLAGDILDTHEKIDSQLMNKAYKLVQILRKNFEVYILVGNHDYINNQQFLTENHWMNGMKEWDKVTIVDKPIVQSNFTFVPYVPPGRFVEALNQIKGWELTQCIYAHQEFRGCKMGAIISETGDKWDINYPLVISGHIHEPQRPQENIIYPGSAINHSYGYDSQGVSVFEFTGNKYPYETKICLGFPKKHIVYTSLDNIDTIKESQLTKATKFNIEGSLQDIKAFKESSMYKKMVKKSKVILKVLKKDTDQRFKSKSFKDILEDMIITSENEALIKEYKTILESMT